MNLSDLFAQQKPKLTTYSFRLLQAKASRILKREMDIALEPYNISSIEWALLGLLYDTKEGMRLSQIAEELGVEAPFVTKIMRELTKDGFLETKSDPEDKRAKTLVLSSAGRKFVPRIEKVLGKKVAPIFKDASSSHFAGYVNVLMRIAAHERAEAKKGKRK